MKKLLVAAAHLFIRCAPVAGRQQICMTSSGRVSQSYRYPFFGEGRYTVSRSHLDGFFWLAARSEMNCPLRESRFTFTGVCFTVRTTSLSTPDPSGWLEPLGSGFVYRAIVGPGPEGRQEKNAKCG